MSRIAQSFRRLFADRQVGRSHAAARVEVREAVARGRGWDNLKKNVEMLGVDSQERPKMKFSAKAR